MGTVAFSLCDCAGLRQRDKHKGLSVDVFLD